MNQLSVLDLAKQGQPKAIAAIISKALEDQAKIQTGFHDEVFIVRLIADPPRNQAEIVGIITKVLERIESPKIQSCKIEAYDKPGTKPIWTKTVTLAVPAIDTASKLPNLTAKEEDSSLTEALTTTQLTSSKGSSWKFPGVNFGGLKQVGEQVADQAVKLAQDTVVTTHGAASKATEQALRNSIDQTMNAFQIAVEQIHDRQLPAKMAALTGTINVGIIQLSIRLDIPMNEETGEIIAEMKEN